VGDFGVTWHDGETHRESNPGASRHRHPHHGVADHRRERHDSDLDGMDRSVISTFTSNSDINKQHHGGSRNGTHRSRHRHDPTSTESAASSTGGHRRDAYERSSDDAVSVEGTRDGKHTNIANSTSSSTPLNGSADSVAEMSVALNGTGGRSGRFEYDSHGGGRRGGAEEGGVVPVPNAELLKRLKKLATSTNHANVNNIVPASNLPPQSVSVAGLQVNASSASLLAPLAALSSEGMLNE
jgi:hypothetical protein